MLMIKFIYLDAGGNVIEDFPHTISGEYDFDTERTGPVVGAGQTTEKKSYAAFLPDNAAGLRFELQRAEFPDGTNWESE